MAKSTETTTPNGPSSWEVPGFVCGLLGVIVPAIGLILGILGIIFSLKQQKTQRTSMARAGLILGIVAIVVQVLIIAYIILSLLAMQSAAIAG